ncbi:hypothetical protein NQ317_008564 [Molorchus minor]|uniref:XRE family transcriptional regulator n=1 Tax=Molorchus minor TaxID=1323400 RepID=A0ABQ9JPA9_9CUCU|nr:hypothetical protein NQ317_008564 [Molorchus minor]
MSKRRIEVLDPFIKKKREERGISTAVTTSQVSLGSMNPYSGLPYTQKYHELFQKELDFQYLNTRQILCAYLQNISVLYWLVKQDLGKPHRFLSGVSNIHVLLGQKEFVVLNQEG